MNSDGHRTHTLPLIVVLGVITAFDAMAIDLYLPGFRDIGRSLGANPGTMQTSLSVFVGGAAIGQLFYGPVTDRFGRRGPLAFGILLFVLASVLAALSQNMAMFMVARALQGLGAAAGLVIPRAIITDRYQGREVAKLFSALLQVMMIAPVVAPPIWRAFGRRDGVAGDFLVPGALWRCVARGSARDRARDAGILTPCDCGPPRHLARLCGPFQTRQARVADPFKRFRHGGAVCLYRLIVVCVRRSFRPTAGNLQPGARRHCRRDGDWRPDQRATVEPLDGTPDSCFWTSAARRLLRRAPYCHPCYGGRSLRGRRLDFLAVASLMLVVGNGIALVMKSAPTSHAGSVSSLLGVLQYAFAGISGAALALAYDATLTPFITAMLLCAVGALIAFVVATRLTAETATPFDGRAVEYP